MTFEEEDFQISYLGYNLYPKMPEAKCMDLLKEAEEDLTKILNNLDDKNNTDEIFAIINRLKFVRFLLKSLDILWPKDNIYPTETEINKSVRLLNGASELIPLIKKTIEKGTQPEEKCKYTFIFLYIISINHFVFETKTTYLYFCTCLEGTCTDKPIYWLRYLKMCNYLAHF